MQVSQEQRDLTRPPFSSTGGAAGSSEALYGSGRSKFYVNPDPASYETLQQLPSQKQPTVRNTDRTLYLANSTFFRDNNTTSATTSAPSPPVYRSVSSPSAAIVKPPSSRLPPLAMSASLPAAMAAQRPPPPPTAPKPVYALSGESLPRVQRDMSEQAAAVPFSSSIPKAPTRRKGVCHGELTMDDSEQSELSHAAHRDPGMKVQLPGLAKGGTACRTRGCSFFGAPETSFFCSKCYRESARELQASRV